MPDPPNPIPPIACWNCSQPLTEATSFTQETYEWDAAKAEYRVTNVDERSIECARCGADVADDVLRRSGAAP